MIGWLSSMATLGSTRPLPKLSAAIRHFGTINVLVNNAGIFYTKPFTDFTTEDFNALVSVNLLGFLYITQLTVKQMLKQRSGNVVSITAALADQPVAAAPFGIQQRGIHDLNQLFVLPGEGAQHCLSITQRWRRLGTWP